MFSEAISSILSCWRFSSPPIAAAISGSADARSSCQKRCIEGGAGTGAVSIGQEYSAAGVGKLVDPALMPAFKEIGRHEGFEAGNRSEERRVGKEWVSTCRSRGSPEH